VSPVPEKSRSSEYAEREQYPLSMVNVTSQGVVSVSALEIISVSKVQPGSKLLKSPILQPVKVKVITAIGSSLLRFIGLVGIGRCKIGPFANHDVSF